MTDPVLIAMAVAGVRAVIRLVDALAERLVLHARRDLIQAARPFFPLGVLLRIGAPGAK